MSYLEISTVATAATGPGVEVWCMTRPERGNAIGPTLAGELSTALASVVARVEKPRAIVLTAKPAVKGKRRVWVAGGDLKELVDCPLPADGERYARVMSDLLAGLDALPLPVLVALDGEAIGGGAELALGGDIRLATRDSRLVFKQLAVGLATGFGGAGRLVELVGLGRAQGLLYGTQSLTAAEALQLGLVHEVVDDAEALAAATEARLTHLVALDPKAFATQKAMLRNAVDRHPGTGRETELQLFRSLWGNATHRSFLTAFAAGRKRGDGSPS